MRAHIDARRPAPGVCSAYRGRLESDSRAARHRSGPECGMTPMQALINVDVDDLDKATHFYETAFGLKVGRRFGADGVELLGSSAPIYLLFKAAGTAAS